MLPLINHSLSQHGNLCIIDRCGVLIQGNPGIGKSTLSLDLLKRGHQFVCDDVVDLCCENNKLIGIAPPLYHGFLLIPNKGLIDIQKRFGMHAVKEVSEIHMIIHLTQSKSNSNQIIELLGIPLPQYRIPAYPRYNLAQIVETLARSHMTHETH